MSQNMATALRCQSREVAEVQTEAHKTLFQRCYCSGCAEGVVGPRATAHMTTLVMDTHTHAQQMTQLTGTGDRQLCTMCNRISIVTTL